MNPIEFVEVIPQFSRLSYVEQIKRFCWYLGTHCPGVKITGGAVSRCFEDSGLPKPSSVAPFLLSLSNQKNRFLIKRNNAYELSRQAREQFNEALSQRAPTVAVHNLLRDLPNKLTLEADKVYLEESLTCFQVKAYRAAVVMVWNLAYDHICQVILRDHLSAFNTQLPKTYPKASISSVTVRDDFEALKESDVLQVAKSANIISGSVHKILKEKLDRRNIAAHPSAVAISQFTAEEFILDLIQNVVLKF